MRIPTFFAALMSLLALAVASDEFDAATPAPNSRTTTIYTWPLASASPTPLATVAFSPRTLTGSISALSNADSGADELVRVGVLDSKTGGWKGSVTTGALATQEKGVVVTLRVDGKGDVWHVEYAANADAVCFG